jgi:hypothetical protein
LLPLKLRLLRVRKRNCCDWESGIRSHLSKGNSNSGSEPKWFAEQGEESTHPMWDEILNSYLIQFRSIQWRNENGFLQS